MSEYSCKSCGAPAHYFADDIGSGVSKTCKCEGPVVTNMAGTVYGESHTGVTNPALAMFHKLGLRILERLHGNRVR